MSSEPRFLIRTWFDPDCSACQIVPGNLIKLNGGLARFEADYELPENDLKNLFLNLGLDIIFSIKKIGTPQPIIKGRTPIGYRHEIGIQPTIIDKWSVDGTISNVATVLMDAALAEVRRIIKANIDSAGTIIFGSGRPELTRIGFIIIYGDLYTVKFDKFD